MPRATPATLWCLVSDRLEREQVGRQIVSDVLSAEAGARIIDAARDHRIFWKRTRTDSNEFKDGEWFEDPVGSDGHNAEKAEKLDGDLVVAMIEQGFVVPWGGLGMYELVIPEAGASGSVPRSASTAAESGKGKGA